MRTSRRPSTATRSLLRAERNQISGSDVRSYQRGCRVAATAQNREPSSIFRRWKLTTRTPLRCHCSADAISCAVDEKCLRAGRGPRSGFRRSTLPRTVLAAHRSQNSNRGYTESSFHLSLAARLCRCQLPRTVKSGLRAEGLLSGRDTFMTTMGHGAVVNVEAHCYVRVSTAQQLRVSDWHKDSHQLAAVDDIIKEEALGSLIETKRGAAVACAGSAWRARGRRSL